MERKLHISGMSCSSCETKVKQALLKVEGVSAAQVSYSEGTAFIKGKNLPSDTKLKSALENAGYKFEKEKFPWGFLGLLSGVIVVFIAAQALYGSLYFDPTSSSITLGLVVVYGLVSSLHCIGMCGGIAFGTSISSSVLLPGKRVRQYQSGRILSYTLSGLLLGMLGRVFTINPLFTNALLLIAGMWMIFLALNMAKVIRIRLPEFNLFKKNIDRAPFVVGLLNALMPCGSLQTMQIVALGTANPFYGAGVMFVFALTTAPALIGMQWLGARMNAFNTRRIQLAAALLVALMGLQMTLRSPLIAAPVNAFMETVFNQKANAPIIDGYQVVNLHLKNGTYIVDYPRIKVGVPVKLSFSWEGIVGCTNPLELTFLNKTIDVKSNPQPVIFTPDKKGNLEIVCWMHMVRTYLYVQ